MPSQPDSSIVTEHQSMQQQPRPSLGALLPTETFPTDSKRRDFDHYGHHHSPSPSAFTPYEQSRLEKSPTTPRTPQRPISTISKSYFESDTDSGEDESVMGRANSVRIMQPCIVHHSPSKASRAYRVSTKRTSVQDCSTSPLSGRISEASESMTSVDEVERVDQGSEGPLEKRDASAGVSSETTEGVVTEVEQTEHILSLREGLRMNPPTENDRINVQRAMSAPVRRRTHLSGRRVRIRPSDIRVETPKEGVRPFRETVVTTPYPTAENKEEKGVEDEVEDKDDTAVTKYARDDRFPSIDQAEVLFLDLNLAQHPAATARLEIRITDRNAFDDEMLFRQIRETYRGRLLRTSRLPFSFIRCVAHATVSPLAQHDFRTAEFVMHFHKPRCGRGRRSWVIWLRHHSLQQPYALGKQPLSARSRTTDRRLSMHSDTTSTFNFSFLPPSFMARVPFFNKEPTAPLPVPTFISPPLADYELARDVVEIQIAHEFSVWVLALLFFGTILCSMTVTVIWVLFGVPGSRPNNRSEMAVWGILVNNKASWQSAAQERVLTGLVLGILVTILGSIVDLCLVWGAYIFL